ncbi:MAG: glutathione peroxidase [Bacteroidetes bacterium]|nr:glutathione peroxidase [Bacteroidota bacterium]
MKIILACSTFLILLFFGFMCSESTSNQNGQKAPVSFYSLKVTMNDGTILSFDSLKGKKILIVNTASHCGFTKQYDDLEKLYQLYKGKLVVIGFPANNFAGQEPGNDAEIAEFCRLNHGVTFPLAAKSSVVKGKDQNEVFAWLSDTTKNGWNSDAPSWNFGKYLINEEGTLTHVFSSGTAPMDEKIISALK